MPVFFKRSSLKIKDENGQYIDSNVLIGNTKGAIDDWLDDHPEATTTVQDGAITYTKLHNNLKGTAFQVPCTNENANGISWFNSYITPQMFGYTGTGDGSTYMGKCVVYAVNHPNTLIYVPGDITISTPIALSARWLSLYIEGELTYTGADYAIKLQYPRQNVRAKSIVCENGGGVKVDTSIYNVEYVDIDVKQMRCKKSCLFIVSEASHYVVYVKAYGNLWNTIGTSDGQGQLVSAEPTINVVVESNGRFVGECSYNKMKLRGGTGFKAYCASASNINGQRLDEVSLEDLQFCGVDITNANSTYINQCRIAELQAAGVNVVKLSGAINGFYFNNSYPVRLDKIVLDNTTLNYCNFDCFIMGNGNSVIAHGLEFGSEEWTIGKIIRPRRISIPDEGIELPDDYFSTRNGIITQFSFSNVANTLKLNKYYNNTSITTIFVSCPGSAAHEIRDYNNNLLTTISGFGQYMIVFIPINNPRVLVYKQA